MSVNSVTATSGLCSHTIASVELILENLLGAVLGLLRSVGVVDVGLVAAGDLSFGRHGGDFG